MIYLTPDFESSTVLCVTIDHVGLCRYFGYMNECMLDATQAIVWFYYKEMYVLLLIIASFNPYYYTVGCTYHSYHLKFQMD